MARLLSKAWARIGDVSTAQWCWTLVPASAVSGTTTWFTDLPLWADLAIGFPTAGFTVTAVLSWLIWRRDAASPIVERDSLKTKSHLGLLPNLHRERPDHPIFEEVDRDEFHSVFDAYADGWTPLINARDALRATRKEGDWPVPIWDNELWRFLADLRQAVCDDVVQMRGRRFRYDGPEAMAGSEPLIAVPANHFVEYEIGFAALHDAKTNWDTFTGATLCDRIAGVSYRDLQLRTQTFNSWREQWLVKH